MTPQHSHGNRDETAPLNVTMAGIPDGDLAATVVALGKQSGGSSPPSQVHLCSPSLELRVGVAFLLPAGVALAQSCLQPFYDRQALQGRQDFVI